MRQGCPLSTALFNVYIKDAIKIWQIKMQHHHVIHDRLLDTLLFADDQIVFADSEDNLQRAMRSRHNVVRTYNLNMSKNTTKIMAFNDK